MAESFTCAICGKEHAGVPRDWGFTLPDELANIPELERSRVARFKLLRVGRSLIERRLSFRSFIAVLFCLTAISFRTNAADLPKIKFEEVRIGNGMEPPLIAGIWSPVGDASVHGRALVVLSHGGGASYQAHSDTAIALARAGLIAAAVTHAGDSTGDQSRVLELWRRPRQLSRLITYMLKEWPGRRTIDPQRVGAFGFSNGGFTVLVSAGGQPDLRRIGPYCNHHPSHDLCTALTRAGLDPSHLPIRIPRNAWRRDPRIKTIVVEAPAFGFTFDRKGLSRVQVPVQIWSAADDRHQPHPYYDEAVRDALPGPVDYHLIPLAGHFDFLQPCDRDLTVAAPEICKDPPGFDRAAFHQALNTEIVRFFRAHLHR